MKTLYITAGHTLKGTDNGAVTPYGNEAEEARKLVTALAKALYKEGVYVYTDDDKWSLSETMAWLRSKVKSPDYTIDFHFNAFNGKASGVETLIPDNYNAKEFELAHSLSEFISLQLGIVKRGGHEGYEGVKKESESQHSRLGILSGSGLATANNLLVEVCFIDNKEEMIKYQANFDKLVEGLTKIFKSL